MRIFRNEFRRPVGTTEWERGGVHNYKEPKIFGIEQVVPYFSYWTHYEWTLLPESKVVIGTATSDGVEFLALFTIETIG